MENENAFGELFALEVLGDLTYIKYKSQRKRWPEIKARANKILVKDARPLVTEIMKEIRTLFWKNTDGLKQHHVGEILTKHGIDQWEFAALCLALIKDATKGK